MAVNPISAVGTNTTRSSAASATSPGSERNLFMTLLVAQLKNQDPLQPQDGTAFVAQLAQFNSLDQLVGIRQSIESLVAALANAPAPSTTPTTPTNPTTTPTNPNSDPNRADLG
jgi:flagellar basal-body rod modification protein FlgD